MDSHKVYGRQNKCEFTINETFSDQILSWNHFTLSEFSDYQHARYKIDYPCLYMFLNTVQKQIRSFVIYIWQCYFNLHHFQFLSTNVIICDHHVTELSFLTRDLIWSILVPFNRISTCMCIRCILKIHYVNIKHKLRYKCDKTCTKSVH